MEFDDPIPARWRAYHEAGHAILALYLGIEAYGASIEIEEGREGHVRLGSRHLRAPEELVDAPEEDVKRASNEAIKICKVLLAGYLTLKELGIENYKAGANQDYGWALRFIKEFVAPSRVDPYDVYRMHQPIHLTEYQSHLKRFECQVLEIIRQNEVWRAIEDLADRLEARKKIAGDEWERLIAKYLEQICFSD